MEFLVFIALSISSQAINHPTLRKIPENPHGVHDKTFEFPANRYFTRESNYKDIKRTIGNSPLNFEDRCKDEQYKSYIVRNLSVEYLLNRLKIYNPCGKNHSF